MSLIWLTYFCRDLVLSDEGTAHHGPADATVQSLDWQVHIFILLVGAFAWFSSDHTTPQHAMHVADRHERPLGFDVGIHVLHLQDGRSLWSKGDV
jgi:hypothetical protein